MPSIVARRGRRSGWVLAVCCILFGSPLTAAAQAQTTGTILVATTTQGGAIRLPGVVLTISRPDGPTIATQFSDEEGRCRFPSVAPGTYWVTATLSGFDDTRATVRVEAGVEAAARLDLPVSGISEHVEVIGRAENTQPTIAETLAPKAVLDSRTVAQLPIRDNSVLSALKLLAGIVQGPGGVSIKGGRPNQSAIQLGMASLTDPTTGTPLFRLPADAVDSVEVFANPYAVEFGRFSSGMTVVNTKRAGDAWQVTLNSPDVSFRTVRHRPWAIKGLESFGPRIGVGGPLVKGRLFLQQSAQMRYEVGEAQSRSQDDTRTTKWLSAFTRVDANLTPRQSLTGTLNIFPSRTDAATLNTFNGPEVAADVNDTLLVGNAAAHSTVSDSAVVESTVQMGHFDVNVAGHGTSPMELVPEGNTGHFFNRQHRRTDTFQWVEAATGSRSFYGVQHLFKFGLDLLRTTFVGTSDSSAVDIRRPDGTLARRLTFGGPIEQRVRTTDVALFAQDRVQAAARLLVEAGVRIDRDGVLNRINGTPRVGAVVLLNASGTTVLRGGYGLFFERTPSVVGAFDQFETTTDRRYATDGTTPITAPMVFVHRAATDLDTARSTTWNLGFDDRLNQAWFLRTALLSRRGVSELVVSPMTAGSTSELRLTSEGRSSYREAELTLRYAPGPGLEASGSYVRASAYANLNTYTAFFDSVRWPIISTDAYAPTGSDIPHRFVGRFRALVGSRWSLSSVVEVRTGFPYSAVNETLDWIGPRNQQFHFPTVAVVDLGIERQFNLFKWKPWIGLRAYNALNAFVPTEVQANVASAAFGSLYNSYHRQIRLQVRIDR